MIPFNHYFVNSDEDIFIKKWLFFLFDGFYSWYLLS